MILAVGANRPQVPPFRKVGKYVLTITNQVKIILAVGAT